MFSGIIEKTGKILQRIDEKNLSHFFIENIFNDEIEIDDSVAHNGVCLTVCELSAEQYKVSAIAETLNKTNASDWQVGAFLNLERALKLNDRLDGHIVQGHVDDVATCIAIRNEEHDIKLEFEINEKFSSLIIEKGSVCLNGISLTCFDVAKNNFAVSIIPYTWQHTNLHNIKISDKVNIEFDILGKYLQRHLSLAGK